MPMCYTRTQVLLDPEVHRQLKEISQRESLSLSELVRQMLDAQLRQRRREALSAAARALLADYANDDELTAFTALDGEDFEGVDAQG